MWNTPHLRQWQNYCVSPPGCHNPSQSIRSASQLPIQSEAFSGEKKATWLKRRLNVSERTDSSLQHMWLFGTLPCSFSFLNPWNLTLARLFARRSGGDAVRRGARCWTDPSERSGRPWTNLKRHFPNTYTDEHQPVGKVLTLTHHSTALSARAV